MAVNVYQLVTDRIIAELEKGHIPWQKPWTGVRTGAYSYVTGRPYSLLNQLMLMKPGEYLTYKQAIAKGGTVRKGEKSQIVVFWKPFEVIKEKEDGSKEKQMIPLLKYYNVFRIDQCEGTKPRFAQEELKPVDPINEAESVLSGYSQRTGCLSEMKSRTARSTVLLLTVSYFLCASSSRRLRNITPQPFMRSPTPPVTQAA